MADPLVAAAEAVLPCADLGPTLAFFTERLGFRVEAISPADHPEEAAVVGYGLRLRFDPQAAGDPGTVRLLSDDPDAVAGGERRLVAPNGTRVEILPARPPVDVPPLVGGLVVTRADAADGWGVGRAGMRYRDLLPDRLGGRFIASHIAIPDGGPVPDYVHFHRIRFQMIFCRRGWVRVAYEDQGEPIVMHAGDCVLQPPEIRHRVLEASPGMEVVEIACPARHETRADLGMTLPTPHVRPERDFGGQRFVFHVAADSPWTPWRQPGFVCQDTGIGTATDGLAGVRVVRADGAPATAPVTHAGELRLLYVLAGSAVLEADGHDPQPLRADDCLSVPAGLAHALTGTTPDLALLEVTLPADLPVA